MSALESPMAPVEISRRRAHSPAAIKASATIPRKHHARAGPEPALLDRIAHQEEAAERERDAAGPDHPLRAEALLEAGLGL